MERSSMLFTGEFDPERLSWIGCGVAIVTDAAAVTAGDAEADVEGGTSHAEIVVAAGVVTMGASDFGMAAGVASGLIGGD